MYLQSEINFINVLCIIRQAYVLIEINSTSIFKQ